jgi:hypothetical protein
MPALARLSASSDVPAPDAYRTARQRWLLGGLLFLVTVINYVDRQVASFTG